jgi:hypothetical protein
VSSAQIDSIKRSTTTILFGDGKIVDNSPRYKYNAIKINFLDFLVGKYGLYYESKLSNAFGIEFGGGITGRNIVGNGFRDVLFDENKKQNSPTFSAENDIVDNDYDFDSRESSMGYFFTLVPKWYYQKDQGLDGNYFALNLQFRRYNFDAYGIDTVNTIGAFINFSENVQKIKEFENNYVAGLAWGKQMQTGIITFDFLFSTGIVYMTGKKRDVGVIESSDPDIGIYPVTAKELREVSKIGLHIEAAIKFGFCWK